jgi:small conductance mechanosensitive channel
MNFELVRQFIEELINNFAIQTFQVIVILIVCTIVRKAGISILKRLFSFKIGRLKRSTIESLKQKETIKQLCINVFKYAMSLLKIVLIISVFVPIGTLMASVGAFAIMITFAFQNMLGDIVRGFFIIFEEMFMVGDWIEVVGFKGEVQEIGLRTTKLKLFETGEIVLIPNNTIGIIRRIDIDRLIKERDESQAVANA